MYIILEVINNEVIVRANEGNKRTIIKTTVSEIQNGNDPLITVVTGNFVTPLTANKFNPTGGITLPISIHKAVKIPRCTGSTPRAKATGK